MPPKEQSPRRGSTSSRPEGSPSKSTSTHPLITFVNSQDPKSRSAIQRHTAHHSNAQRRDARIQSLRSNRPRLLEWHRRPSAEVDALSVSSPQTSVSSASVSPAPTLRVALSAPSEILKESTHTSISNQELAAALPPRSTSEEHPGLLASDLSDTMVGSHLNSLCSLIHHDTYRSVIEYIKAIGTCSKSLLMAYILACRGCSTEGLQAEIDLDDAQRFYGIGTHLLRDSLTNPETASSDENIQAVLLLIAYASDTGSAEEVSIHASALSRMIRQRGGLRVLKDEVDFTLMLQLRAISRSRRRHLTLECEAECTVELRFSQGLEVPELRDES